MTIQREHMENQLREIMSVLGASGRFDELTIQFLYCAVKDKLDRQERSEEKPPVGRQDYIDALVDRVYRLDEQALGRFVKKTLWTATDKVKKED